MQLHTERLVALDAAESGLCFGRLDRRDVDVPRYIGRIGLLAEDGDEEPLLVDWRAPAAQPFYTATPLHDLGVRRRRHIRTRGRTVVGIADETLDLDDPRRRRSGPALAGESVLLAALNATRTGRMTDIVRTIQAEQDRIIRADAPRRARRPGRAGHRQDRRRPAPRGLPALHAPRAAGPQRPARSSAPPPRSCATSPTCCPPSARPASCSPTSAACGPGCRRTRAERPEVAEVKGRLAMADVIAAAVAAAAGRPRRTGGDRRSTGRRCGSRPGRRRPGPHPRAGPPRGCTTRPGPAFARAGGRPAGPASTPTSSAPTSAAGRTCSTPRDVAALRREVAAEPAVHALIDRLWPRLTAERLVARPVRLPRAARRGDPRLERRRPRRCCSAPASAPWTPADVPLLEEADELLGVDDSARAGRRPARRAAPPARRPGDPRPAARLPLAGRRDRGGGRGAQRRRPARRRGPGRRGRRSATPGRRPSAPPPTAPGPTATSIVDEAQELSAMAWRLLLRRCPTRSMTVVGDVAQTGSLAGATSWAEVLDPAPRHALAAGGADRQLPHPGRDHGRSPPRSSPPAAPTASAGASVRSTGVQPWALRVAEADLAAAVAEAAAEFDGGGRARSPSSSPPSRRRRGAAPPALPGVRRTT